MSLVTTSAFIRTARSTSSLACAPCGTTAPSGSSSIRSRMAGSAMKPALITSARPLTYSAGGQRFEHGQVGEDPGRLVKRAHQVLAVGRVDRGLATDGRVGDRQQGRGHEDHTDTAQPGGGHEAGQVRGGPAANPHDRVAAGDAVRGQPRPEPRGHRDLLGGLPRRDRFGVHEVAGGGEGAADRPGDRLQALGMDDDDRTHGPDQHDSSPSTPVPTTTG